MKQAFLIHLAAFILFITGCANAPISPSTENQTSNEVEKTEVPERIALYWENTTAPHPERKPWSDLIIETFRKDLAVYSKATDILDFCPKFASLSAQDRLKAFGELWVAVAYYESGFKPTSASVDVGKPELKDTWSVGLYQMSVVDQKNYKLDFGFKYEDLLKPLPNIKLALAIFKRQIENRKYIAIPAPNPGLYWAVLRPGGKYDKSDLIAERVKKYAPKCN